MNKPLLRKEMLTLRNSIELAGEKNCQILKKVLKLLKEGNYTSIFSYVSMRNEVDTKAIISALFNVVEVFVPHTLPSVMFPVRYIGEVPLDKTDKYGNIFLNPSDEKIIPQVTLTPLLAFDKDFYRLGYGGGYYDKFFSKVDTLKVGLAFDEQEVDKIEVDNYDIPLDVIVTPTRILRRLN